MEGLSRLILNAKAEGKLKGVGINSKLYISHILFMDDAFLFGCGNFEEWKVFHQIMLTFCVGTSMLVSL